MPRFGNTAWGPTIKLRARVVLHRDACAPKVNLGRGAAHAMGPMSQA